MHGWRTNRKEKKKNLWNIQKARYRNKIVLTTSYMRVHYVWLSVERTNQPTTEWMNECYWMNKETMKEKRSIVLSGLWKDDLGFTLLCFNFVNIGKVFHRSVDGGDAIFSSLRYSEGKCFDSILQANTFQFTVGCATGHASHFLPWQICHFAIFRLSSVWDF